MSVFETSRPAFASTGFGTFFSAVIAAVVAWNETRVTEKMLSGLTNRELDDIGLTRADIFDVARKG